MAKTYAIITKDFSLFIKDSSKVSQVAKNN